MSAEGGVTVDTEEATGGDIEEGVASGDRVVGEANAFGVRDEQDCCVCL